MCGIVGFLLLKQQNYIFDLLYNSLFNLQNRGYDSVGICTIGKKCVISKYAIDDDHIDIFKLLKECKNKHDVANIGIGHTRWATHGKKTRINAHPHFSNSVVVVHNGIIENYNELKQEFNDQPFYSQTDSEVIPKMIDKYRNSLSDLDAIKTTISRLKGTWAILIMFVDDPTKIYICKKSSPVLIGKTDDLIAITSEPVGFNNIVNEYYSLKDGSIVVVSSDGISLIEGKLFQHYNFHISRDDLINNYSHWTYKEIITQPLCFKSCTKNRIINDQIVLPELDNFKHVFMKIKNLILIGCGSSYHAGMIGEKYFKKLGIFNSVSTFDAGEFYQYDIPKENAGAIIISQSGETRDLVCAVEILKGHMIPIIGVINVVGSLLARKCLTNVYIDIGRENGVASTKAFTCQIIVLYMISLWFGSLPISQDFNNFISDINVVINNENELLFKDTSAKIISTVKKSLFILGKEYNYPIALEGSLKIKEISYIHAEGFSISALKHGPYALIDQDTIVIVLLDKFHSPEKTLSVIEEIKCRNGFIIVISNMNIRDDLYDILIPVPQNNTFGFIYFVIVIQYLSYFLSLLNGINPDKPRNLAKVVTVD